MFGAILPDEYNNIAQIVFEKYLSSPENENKKETIFIQNSKENEKAIYLLDIKYKFDITQFIPRFFTITTKNGSYYFNKYMLENSCSTIAKLLKEDPTIHQYHLKVDDENNIMSKFEKMYQGQMVAYSNSEFQVCKQITQELGLEKCPDNMRFDKNQTQGFNFNFSWNLNFNYSLNVKLNIQKFEKFVRTKYPETFIIETKRKKYQCNEIGVCSAKVINEFIQKNPEKNHFVYDFDDEFDEFQDICNFFNFKHVFININNMNSLKLIAEDLQIDFIYNDINQFITEYEKISQSIDNQQSLINSIDELFDWLYNIDKESVESVKEKIMHSSWIKTEGNVQELAAFILQVILNNTLLHSYLADLLIILDKEANQKNKLEILLPFIIKHLMYSFAKDSQNSSFVFNLYKRGAISKESIFDELRCFTKNALIENIRQRYNSSWNTTNKYPFLWFLPEIYEILEFDMPKLLNCFAFIENSFITFYFPNKIEDFKRMRDSGEPDDVITKTLRCDDVNTLQSIISSSDTKINEAQIPFNIFENFLQKERKSYLNYAAAYGSVKCFKFLLLNHASIENSTFKLAVCGSNIEIIRIVSQQTNNFNQTISIQNTEEQILPSIKKHQNDLLDWLIDQKLTSNNLTNNQLSNLINISIENGNAHSIIQIVDKGFNFALVNKMIMKNMIDIASSKGFYKLLQLLFILMDQKLKEFGNNSLIFNCISAVSFGNLSIFKFILEKNDTKEFIEEAFIYAVSREYMNIINYIFENKFSKQFSMSKEQISRALQNSIKSKSCDLFKYLIEKFKIVNPNIFDDFTKKYNDLLTRACKINNIEIIKAITEIILEENPNNDFTPSFKCAASINSLEICQYFIDKKVIIEYESLALQVDNLINVNKETMEFIFKNCTPEAKEIFLSIYLNEAIQNKNIDLIEFLLNETEPSDDSLFYAIKMKNLEIVEMILKHKSDPSFINQKSNEGTALNLAVVLNNFPIFKRLLSIPGIDPSIYGPNNASPLSTAIANKNIEVVEAIIDFYGSDINSQIWQFDIGIKELMNKFPSINSNYLIDNKTVSIINKLIEIDKIDLNYHNGKHTILSFLCMSNQIELVKKLLDTNRVDVNTYNSTDGNTALIISIINKNINMAKLLINYPKTNINANNFEKQTALTLAVSCRFDEIVSLIINHEKFDPEESHLSYAFYISRETVSELLFSLKNLDVNYRYVQNKHQDYTTPRMQVNDTNVYETTLTQTIKYGDTDKVDLIIKHPSFNPYKSQTKKAIFLSVSKCQISTFNKLLNLGIYDVNLKNSNGESLLVQTIDFRSTKIVSEILKNKKFDSDKSDIRRAFIQSFKNPTNVSYDIMKEICDYDENHEHFIDFKKLLNDGTSYFTSITTINEDINKLVDFFIEHGADPNTPDKNGVYPLEYAIIINSLPYVCALINSNKIDYSIRCSGTFVIYNTKLPDSNQTSAKQKTFLHLAARSKSKEILTELLNKNAIDINSTDELGETPLMDACRARRSDCIIELFKRDDLDYLHKNNNGHDALEIMHLLTSKNVIELFKINTKEEYCNDLLANLNVGFTISNKSLNLIGDQNMIINADNFQVKDAESKSQIFENKSENAKKEEVKDEIQNKEIVEIKANNQTNYFGSNSKNPFSFSFVYNQSNNSPPSANTNSLSSTPINQPNQTAPNNDKPAFSFSPISKESSAAPNNDKPAFSFAPINKESSAAPNNDKPAFSFTPINKESSAAPNNDKPAFSFAPISKESSAAPNNEKPAFSSNSIDQPSQTAPNTDKPVFSFNTNGIQSDGNDIDKPGFK